MILRVATVNLGRGASTARFTSLFRTLLRHLTGAVVCFQEIDEDDLPPERRIIGRLMRAAWWFAGRRTKVMIAIPRTWVRVDGRVTWASAGIRRVSPARPIVTIIARHRIRRSLPPVAFVDVHFPYVNPRHDRTQQVAARRAWHEVYEHLVVEVDRLANLGHTVVICSDTNNPHTPAPHPRAQLVAGAGGIDKVWIVEGSVAVDVVATDSVWIGLDGHRAHIARLELTKAPATKETR